MKLQKFLISKITFILLFVTAVFFLSQKTFASTIAGIVYDNKRNPLTEVDVELLDDYYRLVNRTKTNASGRYEFGGLGDGRFTVRVLPFRYDFADESALVEITTITSVSNQVGNTYLTQDFYLTPRKGSLADTETGVIFAQETPKEAQKIYEAATKDLSRRKNDEGIAGLRKAINIFPDYFLALQSLGKELFAKDEYGEAIQILLKASEVNPNSPTTFYYMGYSLVKLNYTKAAIIPLNQALSLAPSSVQILYVLGIAETGETKYLDAEKHLLQAEKLSKADVPEIHWQLAQLYGNHLRKFKEAADELELYLKTGKFDEEQKAKIKKTINELREKAKKSG